MKFRISPRYAAVAGIGLMLVAAACGSTTANTNTRPTATPQTPGSSAFNGCPTQQAPADASTKPASIVLTEANGGATAQPVSIKNGQMLEVHLTATVRWALSLQNTTHVLTPSSSEGWYDAQSKMCIWRFTTTAAGSASLIYAGGLVCDPSTTCPTIAKSEEFDITVQ